MARVKKLTGSKEIVADRTLPLPFYQSEGDYMPIFSIPATTELIKVINKKPTSVDRTGKAKIDMEKIGVEIEKYTQGDVFKVTTNMFLQMASNKLKELNNKKPQTLEEVKYSVTLPIDEYMDKRKISHRQTAIEEIEKAADILTRIRISSKTGKTKFDYMNLFGRIKFDDDNYRKEIIIEFTPSFAFQLMDYFYNLPLLNLRVDSNKFPNAAALSNYIANLLEIHRTQRKTPEYRIFTIENLLENCPYIPTYEEVKKGNRAYANRIIEPFEKTMEALEEILTWEYCGSLGKPLKDEELAKPKYKDWVKWKVKIEWK